jgi:hypothetical protein
MSKAERDNDNEILYGWKSIADCLGCSTKTAQRLEKREGLPILRPGQRQKWRVLALRRSLVDWVTGGIETTALSGNSLLAFNRRTRLQWSYEFTARLPKFTSEELDWRLHVVDLNQKGERGVLFAARFLSSTHPDTLFYFSPQGKLEWKLEAEPPLKHQNGKSFDRAWRLKHMVVTSVAKSCKIWVALANTAGWAGCVLGVNANGMAAVHFANTGFVEQICPVNLNDNALVICGENNDFDDAFVALIGQDDPPSCSIPGDRLVYRFGNAPRGSPRKYIRFPRPETIAAQRKPYGHAVHVTQHPDGLIVDVETGPDGAYFRYHFSNDLEPRYVFPSGSHEFVHQTLERSGAVTHAWPDCPELQAPLILRSWEPDSGWYDQPIPWRDNPWKEIRGANT